MLNVVFMHYHLRPGGVTSVILRQINALDGIIKPLLIIGEEPEVDVNCDYFVIPSIAYDRDRTDNLEPSEITQIIIEKVVSYFGIMPHIFHIHNPTLGKNKDFIGITKILAQKGANLFLQIHDFAEDGRPANFQQDSYPENVHYGVINRRDYNYLIMSGLSPDGLHLIPNIVEVKEEFNYKNPEDKRLIVYPIRAIRRKNVGEAIFLSLFFEDGDYLGITLKPTAMIDIVEYEKWVDFTKDKGLNISFEIGINRPFYEVVRDSKMMITTSIKEGFGMSFLEPWLFGRPITGRILLDICQDFMDNGIKLDLMYDRLVVPVDFVNLEVLKARLYSCYLKNMKQYGVVVDEISLKDSLNKYLAKEVVDFGILSEDMQRKIIIDILVDSDKKKKIIDLNPKIINLTFSKEYMSIVEHNKRLIKRLYSSNYVKELLVEIYKKVLSKKVNHSIDKYKLVRVFNSVENLSLLLCEN